MNTAWLIGQKVGHFVAVLFLSSLVLAAFLWVSPGSPGRPRGAVDWSQAKVGSTVVCLDSEHCGQLQSKPAGEPPEVSILVRGETRSGRADFVKMPGSPFISWFFGGLWGGLFKGDVGLSTAYSEPALDVVMPRIGPTLRIVAVTLAISLVIALVLVGFLTWLPFPSLRGALRTGLLVLSITPVFILGYVLQQKGILPHGRGVSLTIYAACVAVLVVGDSNLGEMLLQFENEVRHLRSRDYIHAAGLRGASVFKHMLPGLLLPISSISAGKVAFLLGSVVIVEKLFVVPGLGDASLNAAEKGDALLLIVLTLVVTGVVALTTLARDVLEILVDPRLRRSGDEGT